MASLVETSPGEPLANMASWKAYAGAPSGALLGGLLKAADRRGDELLELLEHCFVVAGNWRVAQHLALLYVGRFSGFDRRDVVRAFYYARRAVELSKGDPHARLALARVYWERRLHLAVFHEVDLAQTALELDNDLQPAQAQIRDRNKGECANPRGLAFAYLVNPVRALPELKRAQLLGGLTIEAAQQLLLVAVPEHAEESEWAASLLTPLAEQLGGRVQAFLANVWRGRLVTLLCRRPRPAQGPTEC
jgi:hypothetical protein